MTLFPYLFTLIPLYVFKFIICNYQQFFIFGVKKTNMTCFADL